MLFVASPPMVVAGPITKGLHLTTTITTHILTGEERRQLISPPGPSADQAGVCQGVAALESLVRCSTTTGSYSSEILSALDPLDQGDGGDICSGQRPNRKREGASIWSNWDSFLPRQLRAGQPHESRGVEFLVAVSSTMFTGRG